MENTLYSVGNEEPLEIFSTGKLTFMGCVLGTCQAVCFLQAISLGGLRGRLLRQSNWVVVFRIIWKRKGIGDENIIVTARSYM